MSETNGLPHPPRILRAADIRAMAITLETLPIECMMRQGIEVPGNLVASIPGGEEAHAARKAVLDNLKAAANSLVSAYVAMQYEGVVMASRAQSPIVGG